MPFPVPDSALGARYPAFGVGPAPVPGIRSQVPDSRYPIPGTQNLAPVFEKPAHGVCILYPASILNRAFAVRGQAQGVPGVIVRCGEVTSTAQSSPARVGGKARPIICRSGTVQTGVPARRPGAVGRTINHHRASRYSQVTIVRGISCQSVSRSP